MNALVGGQTDFMCADVVTGGASVPRQDQDPRGHVPQTQCSDPERAEHCGSRAS
jgi:hypothetical protein